MYKLPKKTSGAIKQVFFPSTLALLSLNIWSVILGGKTVQLKKLGGNQNQCRVFDVADTASGTDWIILSHHQFLMHCLQHLNKHLGGSNMNSCNTVPVTHTGWMSPATNLTALSQNQSMTFRGKAPGISGVQQDTLLLLRLGHCD